MTVRTFSEYQIAELAEIFEFCIVQNIGRVDETGDLIIEYISTYEKGLESKSIPFIPPQTKPQ